MQLNIKLQLVWNDPSTIVIREYVLVRCCIASLNRRRQTPEKVLHLQWLIGDVKSTNLILGRIRLPFRSKILRSELQSVQINE